MSWGKRRTGRGGGIPIPVSVSKGGTGAIIAKTARENLGLAIGTDVQAYDAGLTDIAGLAVADGNFIVGDGSNFVVESGATARTSLGLVIGTDVQAFDAQLLDIAGLAVTDGNFIVGNGSTFVAESGATARTSLGLEISNLTELTSAPDGTDELYINDAGTLKRISVTNSGFASGSAFKGAKATLSADLTSQNFTSIGTIPFDAEDFDTDTFHDTVTNNDRFTISSTFNGYYVEVSAHLRITLGTDGDYTILLIIHYNSSDVEQDRWAVQNDDISVSTNQLYLSTGPINVATGDYFTANILKESDTSITVEGPSASGMETSMEIKVLGT